MTRRRSMASTSTGESARRRCIPRHGGRAACLGAAGATGPSSPATARLTAQPGRRSRRRPSALDDAYVGLAVDEPRRDGANSRRRFQRGADVPEQSPPSVSLTSPAPGSYPAPTLNMAATASDPEGQLTRVEFYNGRPCSAATTTPYGPRGPTFRGDVFADGFGHRRPGRGPPRRRRPYRHERQRAPTVR